MNKAEILELIDYVLARLEELVDRKFKDIDQPDLDPIELALEESGYEDSEADAFMEGYMRAEEDLASE